MLVFRLDPKHVFKDGLQTIRTKLNNRAYTSVAVFSADLASVLSSDLGVEVADTAELQQQVSGRAVDMTVEQREHRKLAKRIVKAVQPALEEALRNEGELSGRPFEKQIRELDMMLDHSILSRRESFSGSVNEDEVDIRNSNKSPESHETLLPSIRNKEGSGQTSGIGVNGFTHTRATDLQDVEMVDAPIQPVEEVDGSIAQLNGELSADAEHVVVTNTPPASTNGIKGDSGHGQACLPESSKPHAQEPPTPPLSLGEPRHSTLGSGGIPWYVEPFDPDGTTIYEERWTGPQVMRDMSEELSDMDDDELEGLGGEDFNTGKQDTTTSTTPSTPVVRNPNVRKNGKPRRRWRGFR